MKISLKISNFLKTLQSRRCSSELVGFIRFIQEKFEQGREFRSEVLQEENNERKTRKIQHNQLIIQNKQMQA